MILKLRYLIFFVDYGGFSASQFVRRKTPLPLTKVLLAFFLFFVGFVALTAFALDQLNEFNEVEVTLVTRKNEDGEVLSF